MSRFLFTKFGIKLVGLSMIKKRYWSSYEFYQILCETRSVEHDIFETHSEINIFEYHAKKKTDPILSLLCSESDISVFWPISLTDFSGTWSAQNIIMDTIGARWNLTWPLTLGCLTLGVSDPLTNINWHRLGPRSIYPPSFVCGTTISETVDGRRDIQTFPI